MPKVTETILTPAASNGAGAAIAAYLQGEARAILSEQASELERLLRDLTARREITASSLLG